MTELGTYLWGVVSEGLVIGFLFWAIVYVTMEASSLPGAIKASLIAESIGNLPYLFGEEALSPIGLLMTAIAIGVFIHQILRVRELNLLPIGYGILTTYFVLVAVIACSPQ